MFPGGGGRKQGPLLRNWLVGYTGNIGPLIEGTEPGPTTLLSAGRDESGTLEFCLYGGRAESVHGSHEGGIIMLSSSLHGLDRDLASGGVLQGPVNLS
jgi:hypothetical protein